jgi:hypothetical protein
MKRIALASSFLALALCMQAPAFADNVIRMNAPIAQGNPWRAAPTEYGDWKNASAPTGCTYSPLASTIAAGTSFQQTASGCTVHQTQTVVKKEVNSRTGDTRIVSQSTEDRDLTGYTYTLQSVGTKAADTNCTYTTANSWIELFSASGPSLGLILTYEGVQKYNNFTPSGAQVPKGSFTPQGDNFNYSRGTFYASASGNGYVYAYYGVCRTPN